MNLKCVVAAALGVVTLAVPTAAYADSCGNVSRAPGPCGTATTAACTGPITDGNWVWLPSVDLHAPPIWGFAPPGSPDSTSFQLPGSGGNFLNGAGSSLLDGSANCPADANAVRQTSHGIQSGCE
jgi:hypothetical protein